MWNRRQAMTAMALAPIALGSSSGQVSADEKLAGIACRSVHLGYKAPESLAFLNEVKVQKSAEGTYFCVCGFNQGYYGLQELSKGRKLLIFSVWDPGDQNDPNAVDPSARVKLLYNDPKVRVGRFGGEGTGGQSFLDYDWKVGETYRFLVQAKPDTASQDKRTEFTGWFFQPETKSWRRLVTFSTRNQGKLLGGYYSFIEDFRRNKISATIARKAEFTGGWVLTSQDQKWIPLTSARFTGDSNPATNINAGSVDQRFFLATGGDVKNQDAKLLETFKRVQPDDQKTPSDDVVQLFHKKNG